MPGKAAEYKGLEFSPYLVTSSVLIHRGSIAAVTDANAIFLSKDDREELTKLMDNMGKLCSLELRLAGNPDDTGDYSNMYQNAADETASLIE